MEESDTIKDFISRITRLKNQVKTCGETVTKQYIVAKILRSPRFGNMVVAIKELNDLAKMKKKELQSSLEAQEQSMEERNNDKAKAEVALQTRFNEKDKRLKEKWHMKSKGHFQNFVEESPKVSRIRLVKGVRAAVTKMMVNATLEVKGRGFTKSRSNALSIKETCCNRLRKRCNSLQAEENIIMSTECSIQCNEEWYLDSGCSTHMMGMKDLFVKSNRAMKNKVKFTDDTTLEADGIADILIIRRDGGHYLIKNVLYILGIKCNLLSVGQFLENGYKIHMENKGLCVRDANGVLVLKYPMDANITFKVELKVMEHICLAKTASREEWI
ncbi:uncharacterized protein LOC127104393 [Lathyrus oleraceus]|uniref:uncharacterized protein LOC127104393 n=1 Tax=Pisum sativum TaxID=3888 RepID=UPI0021D1BE91|nr:uncharacterized protein LOC127104393 [Pisum sativum]